MYKIENIEKQMIKYVDFKKQFMTLMKEVLGAIAILTIPIILMLFYVGFGGNY
jgi:hypothetical protein|tara:strand:- start:109 stop:267 length:159 start_codon:yes stop_codon:yes gene_type:complete